MPARSTLLRGSTLMTPADLTSSDATELASRIRHEEITATELIQATLQRIDGADPSLNAFRTVMSNRALADAAAIDALPGEERAALPLAGIPVAVKDDTDVAGESTMWGTAIDRGICEEDAEVVARLRRAGAIIIGKTNVPELTLWPWTASKTWGTTRNPWNPDHTPGGSSGGSAVAVTTGMAAMAIGSDGGGSVRYPAALTGLVGLKPQRDRVPLGAEHASGWHGLIALGPLTRSVRDAALFLDVTANTEHTDTYRNATERRFDHLKIAVSINAPPGSQVSVSNEVQRVVDDAADMLTTLGHETTEVPIRYGLSSIWNSTVRFLAGARDDVASLPDQHLLERRTRAVARMGRAIPAKTLQKQLAGEQKIIDRIGEVFDAADVVMTPLCQSPAPLVTGCPKSGATRSLRAANTSAWLVPWNLAGQPGIAVPTGVDAQGLPTALHLVGRSGDESTLLALAAQIEQHRPFPTLPSRANDNG